MRGADYVRQHKNAALGIAIAAMTAVIVATLHWSEELHRRLAINCEPSPALDSDGPTRLLYLVRIATNPSPEDICSENEYRRRAAATQSDAR